jgi:recombination protein RecA
MSETTWREELENEFGEDIFITGFQGGVISTGSLVVDSLTSVGGFPIGHFVEIFGGEGCGKTTLALNVIRQAMSEGRAVLYEDYESTVSDRYLVRLGINPEELKDYRVTPKSMEDGWMIKKKFCEKNVVKGGVIVVDSLAAMPPIFDIEKMNEIIGHTKIGSQAAVMAQALKQMTRIVRQSNVCVIFVNQERANIDFRGMASGKTTPGGSAIRFYCAMRVHLQARGSITAPKKEVVEGESKEEVTAVKVSVKMVKNKFGPSYREGQIIIRMNEGIDNISSAILMGQKMGVITRKGPYFELAEQYSGDTLGRKKVQGGEKLRQYFLENDKLWLNFQRDIHEYLTTISS